MVLLTFCKEKIQNLKNLKLRKIRKLGRVAYKANASLWCTVKVWKLYATVVPSKGIYLQLSIAQKHLPWNICLALQRFFFFFFCFCKSCAVTLQESASSEAASKLPQTITMSSFIAYKRITKCYVVLVLGNSPQKV